MTVTPRKEALYRAVSAIDPNFLEEAFPQLAPRLSRRLEWLASAAALFAVLLGMVFFPINRDPILLVSGPFVLTADTTNGYVSDLSELTEEMWNQLFSATAPGSPGSKGQFYGKDTFSIEITPQGWDRTEDLFFYYNLRVHYGDTTVQKGPLDPHVAWGFCSPTNTSPPGSTSYINLFGWFDEPTDIRIEILEHDGTVVQEQTIHIEYDSITRSYELKVIDLKIYTEGE